MRDRLIKILREPIPVIKGYDTIGESRMSIVDTEKYADRLLANGVIVPPCKVGDTIYRIASPEHKQRIWEWQVAYFQVYEDEILCIDDSDNYFYASDIGKTVFLTREEAERALKGGEGG